jgi:hypothetical protein
LTLGREHGGKRYRSGGHFDHVQANLAWNAGRVKAPQERNHHGCDAEGTLSRGSDRPKLWDGLPMQVL